MNEFSLISQLCQEYIDSMQEGDRVTFTELTDIVAAAANLPKSNVSSIIRISLKNHSEVEISSGRSGGIFKGTKPKKMDTRKRCESCGQVVKATSLFTKIS